MLNPDAATFEPTKDVETNFEFQTDKYYHMQEYSSSDIFSTSKSALGVTDNHDNSYISSNIDNSLCYNPIVADYEKSSYQINNQENNLSYNMLKKSDKDLSLTNKCSPITTLSSNTDNIPQGSSGPVCKY